MRWRGLVVAAGVAGALLVTVAGTLGPEGLLGSGDATAAAAAPVQVVEGGVSATGAAEGQPQGWSARQTATGRYEVTLPLRAETFELTAWDAVTDVVQTPLGGGRVQVLFTRDAQPVDSRFTFRASLLRP